MTESTFFTNYELNIVSDDKMLAGEYEESSLQLVPSQKNRPNFTRIKIQGKLYEKVKEYNFIHDLSELEETLEFRNPIRGRVVICDNIVSANSINYTYDETKKLLNIRLNPYYWNFLLKEDARFSMDLRIDNSLPTNELEYTVKNNTNFYIYWLSGQSFNVTVDETKNAKFYENNQILFPNESVKLNYSITPSDPKKNFGYTAFSVYFGYQPESDQENQKPVGSVGVYAGNFQLEYSEKQLYPLFFNGSCFNKKEPECNNPGTSPKKSVSGMNPFLTCTVSEGSVSIDQKLIFCSGNKNSLWKEIYNVESDEDIIIESDYPVVNGVPQYDKVPEKLKKLLEDNTGVVTKGNTVVCEKTGEATLLSGASWTASEFDATPGVFNFLNGNSIDAYMRLEVNTVRIPLNSFFMIDDNTNPCIDRVNSTSSGFPFSASQMINLDNMIYRVLKKSLGRNIKIILDLHSTCPIGDTGNSIRFSGWQGNTFPGSENAYAYITAQSPMASATGTKFWVVMAGKYGANESQKFSSILFELFNEPQLSTTVNELNYWWTGTTSLVPIQQTAGGLNEPVNQSVSSMKEMLDAIRKKATNICILSGTCFDANLSWLTTPSNSPGLEWFETLKTFSNIAVGFHAYGQGDAADGPAYIGVPVPGDDSGGILNVINNYNPKFDYSDVQSYAPFGTNLNKDDGTITPTTEDLKNVGWDLSFLNVTNTFPLISTESGTNIEVSALYGNDYLRLFVGLQSQQNERTPGNIHVIPWAWFAGALCYPSLLVLPYAAADPTCLEISGDNLIGAVNTENPQYNPDGDCPATSAVQTATGLFPGYGIFWKESILPLPQDKVIPFSNNDWYYNFGGQETYPIVEVIPETVTTPETMNMNLCNWFENAWYSGNISYKDKLGFGEYSTYIRPSACLNNINTAFYLSLPPLNPGSPDAQFQDGRTELDFELTMFNTDCKTDTGKLNLLLTTNIFKGKDRNSVVVNTVKKDDGTCKTEAQTVEEFPDLDIDYSKTPVNGSIIDYNGSLKFTISWFPEYILWTVQNPEKGIVFQRYINWSAKKDIVVTKNATKVIDGIKSDQWAEYENNYKQDNTMVCFIAVIPGQQWMDCSSKVTPDNKYSSICTVSQGGGYRSTYYEGLTFNPNKTIPTPNLPS